MDQFVGQIMVVPYNFAPRGWAFCQGQLMSISQNTSLYSLLGTYYGGDGRSTFGLPNFAGRMAIGAGTGPGQPTYVQGQAAGTVTISLTTPQMPVHIHNQMGSTTVGTIQTPVSGAFGAIPSGKGAAAPYYVTPGQNAALNNAALTPTGGNLPHPNQMPYLELNYIICLQGVYPQRP